MRTTREAAHLWLAEPLEMQAQLIHYPDDYADLLVRQFRQRELERTTDKLLFIRTLNELDIAE